MATQQTQPEPTWCGDCGCYVDDDHVCPAVDGANERKPAAAYAVLYGLGWEKLTEAMSAYAVGSSKYSNALLRLKH